MNRDEQRFMVDKLMALSSSAKGIPYSKPNDIFIIPELARVAIQIHSKKVLSQNTFARTIELPSNTVYTNIIYEIDYRDLGETLIAVLGELMSEDIKEFATTFKNTKLWAAWRKHLRNVLYKTGRQVEISSHAIGERSFQLEKLRIKAGYSTQIWAQRFGISINTYFNRLEEGSISDEIISLAEREVELAQEKICDTKFIEPDGILVDAIYDKLYNFQYSKPGDEVILTENVPAEKPVELDEEVDIG